MRVFVSYSSDDEDLKEELLTMLAPAIGAGKLLPWDASKVVAGDEKSRVIEAELERADVALVLLSASYLKAGGAADRDLVRIEERRASGGLRVVFIVMSPCDWQSEQRINKDLQVLPRDHRPLSSRRNRADALLEVCREIIALPPPPSRAELAAKPASMAGAEPAAADSARAGGVLTAAEPARVGTAPETAGPAGVGTAQDTAGPAGVGAAQDTAGPAGIGAARKTAGPAGVDAAPQTARPASTRASRGGAAAQAATINWRSPGSVLAAAVQAVPVMKYALGVAGLGAVVTLVTRVFGLDAGTAAVGTLIVLALMVLLIVLGVAAKQSRRLVVPAMVLTWAILLLTLSCLVLLLLSLFFQVPRPLRCLVRDELCATAVKSPEPPARPLPPSPSIDLAAPALIELPVSSTPPGAQVWSADDAPLGTTPCRILVPAHAPLKLHFTAPGRDGKWETSDPAVELQRGGVRVNVPPIKVP